MLFQTPQFLFFLLLVLLLFYAVPFRVGRFVLLAASYTFYMFWNAKFVLLLLLLTVVDFCAALLMPRKRRTLLAVGVSANLAFLGFFKYYNFFAASLAQLLHIPEQNVLLQIVLPVGISFHTFQSISYLVDVYRGEQEPVRNFVDYALFIAFFPQLVAGPIVRARYFFRDLYHWQPPSPDAFSRGCFLILLGMLKKVVLADRFGAVANSYFGDIAAHPGALAAWSGALAFAFQIFFDFSAYTDIAIGGAALFGFHFPENFNDPYFATSITDFWRRWHMSLSSWLRDYLYIPLGGNRHGDWATYRNIMITMLLGGLWHGASWKFMVWGGYQGMLLSLERVSRIRAGIFTFGLVCVGWVFFRADTMADASVVLSQMASFHAGTWLLGPVHLLLIACAVIAARWPMLDRIAQSPSWARVAVIVCGLITLELFAAGEGTVPFIYFQF
ncbi:MAG: MBOAT family protein [Bryobacteraceae bacterium]